MHSWQVWSNSESQFFVTFQTPRTLPRMALYSDNEYTRFLNQILALELGATHLFQLCNQRHVASWDTCLYEDHLSSAKEINRLIILNRGIPNQDGMALSAEVSMMLTRLSSHLSDRLARQTARKLAVTLERILRRRYHKAIQLAPFRDRETLNHLLGKTRSNLRRLTLDATT